MRFMFIPYYTKAHFDSLRDPAADYLASSDQCPLKPHTEVDCNNVLRVNAHQV